MMNTNERQWGTTEENCTIKVHADFENYFEDLTLAPLTYEYNEEEEIAGHRFVHRKDGIFKAEPVFSVREKELKKIVRVYRDVIFYGFWDDNEFEIWFALSEVGCCIDYFWWLARLEKEQKENLADWKWWEEQEDEIKAKMQGKQNGITDAAHDRGIMYTCEDVEEEMALPKKKKALRFLYEQEISEDGVMPRIVVNGYIADMVEPGIYYFAGWNGGRRPELELDDALENRDVAAVAFPEYGIGAKFYMWYLAIEKKYFARLREIADSKAGGFYYEFHKKEAREDIVESNKRSQDTENGEELMTGLGTKEITLRFEIPLVAKRAFKKYEYAAKNGDKLLLRYISEGYSTENGAVMEEFDMRLMTHLEVRQKEMLRCGYEYEVIHKIIDCEEEKYREILTPEAYALYKEQWNQKS